MSTVRRTKHPQLRVSCMQGNSILSFPAPDLVVSLIVLPTIHPNFCQSLKANFAQCARGRL